MNQQLKTILVVGASGATGRLLVRQLLDKGYIVTAVIRPQNTLFDDWGPNENLNLVRATVIDLKDSQLDELVGECIAIVSCLGHHLSFKGIFGPPRRLVTESMKRLCDAVKRTSSGTMTKVVLMNTTGNSNRDIPEKISFAQSCVIGLLRLLLPPHLDNEQAADFLRLKLGQDDPEIKWVVVRPDALTNDEIVSEYDVYPSPIRSAIFDSGDTSRINVANFMARLIDEEKLWETWQGKMPVVYNRAENEDHE